MVEGARKRAAPCLRAADREICREKRERVRTFDMIECEGEV